MENNNSKFNRLTGFFPNKSGNGLSVGVSPEIAEALAGIEVGDRIFLNGLDSDRPWISYAKADPAFQNKAKDADAPTPTPASSDRPWISRPKIAHGQNGGDAPTAARPTPASVVKKPNRVEKF